jgi:hypothetical protein
MKLQFATEEELREYRRQERAALREWEHANDVKTRVATDPFRFKVEEKHNGKPYDPGLCTFYNAAMDGHGLVRAWFNTTTAVLYFQDKELNQVYKVTYRLPQDIRDQIKLLDDAARKGQIIQITPGIYVLPSASPSETPEGRAHAKELKDQIKHLQAENDRLMRQLVPEEKRSEHTYFQQDHEIVNPDQRKERDPTPRRTNMFTYHTLIRGKMQVSKEISK